CRAIAAAIVVLMFTFPILTKKFDLQLGSLNPFADGNKMETTAHLPKEALKKGINPESVFYKPLAKKDTLKQEVQATENIPDEIKDIPVNIEPSALATNPPPLEKSPEPVSVEANTATGLKYHIIAGCFRIEENATKLEADLKSKGFNAEILGKNNAGLTMVSISSYEHLIEAKNSLSEIQSKLSAGVWIFKSK
ncbi:MAG: hypothetical protein ABI855_08130, partial [Bacteroidota bacterium]